MDGGLAFMDIARVRMDSDKLAAIIPLPVAYTNKEVEVIVREIPPVSIVDELYGTASNVKMSDADLREARLNKYATVD